MTGIRIQERPEGGDAPPGRGLHLLVVDDEPFILSALERFFHHMLPGVRVHMAATGKEGLAELARGPIDLIISDFRMPDMDGIEFLVRCSKEAPKALRILFTAHADPEIEQRARAQAHIAAFVPKGADPVVLLETVRKILATIPA